MWGNVVIWWGNTFLVSLVSLVRLVCLLYGGCCSIKVIIPVFILCSCWYEGMRLVFNFLVSPMMVTIMILSPALAMGAPWARFMVWWLILTTWAGKTSMVFVTSGCSSIIIVLFFDHSDVSMWSNRSWKGSCGCATWSVFMRAGWWVLVWWCAVEHLHFSCSMGVVPIYPVDLDAYPLPLEHPRRSK